MCNIWEKTKDYLKQEISEQNMKTWIDPIVYDECTDNNIYLKAPNKFIINWFTDNYKKLAIELAKNINDINYNFILKVDKNITQSVTNKEIAKSVEVKDKTYKIKYSHISNINSKYTFETFVSGPSNQFAHAASLAVANNPATTYNPLFIYGGVGLGKTHIIHSIGNKILKEKPDFKVSYYSSEKFTNELINSLRHGKMEEFRNKFRTIDVLLIDDIQFIAGKKSTQEEFFHTFNSLYESHKQIVVTSDKFPKEMPDLEERLRSRFEWGLIADIQEPDFETKQAILKMKADYLRIELPEDVLNFLASSVTSNVRELEGYLIRLGAYSSLTSAQISLDMAKEVLKNIISENSKEITVEKIIKIVAEHFQIKISDLKSQKRLKNIVLPRQIAMYVSRTNTQLSYPEIGEKFGGKDHSTIIHAIKKIEEKIETDITIKLTVEKIINKLSVF